MLERLDARRDYHDRGRIGDTREYLRRKLPVGCDPHRRRRPLGHVADAILSRTPANSAAPASAAVHRGRGGRDSLGGTGERGRIS